MSIKSSGALNTAERSGLFKEVSRFPAPIPAESRFETCLSSSRRNDKTSRVNAFNLQERQVALGLQKWKNPQTLSHLKRKPSGPQHGIEELQKYPPFQLQHLKPKSHLGEKSESFLSLLSPMKLQLLMDYNVEQGGIPFGIKKVKMSEQRDEFYFILMSPNHQNITGCKDTANAPRSTFPRVVDFSRWATVDHPISFSTS